MASSSGSDFDLLARGPGFCLVSKQSTREFSLDAALEAHLLSATQSK
jgi:hypothetical protein